MICTFCGIERNYAVKGPGVCICASCLAGIGAATPLARTGAACSFCLKNERRSRFRFRRRTIVGVGAGGDARICSDCLPIARGVLVHERNAEDRR